jgi:hypothetical protein
MIEHIKENLGSGPDLGAHTVLQSHFLIGKIWAFYVTRITMPVLVLF